MWQQILIVSVGAVVALLIGAMQLFDSTKLTISIVMGASIWLPFCISQIILSSKR